MPNLKPPIVYAGAFVATLPALGLSTVSTLAAGLAWFFVCLAGFCAWLSRNQAHPAGVEVRSGAGLRAARWWLLACLAAGALMVIPTAYWGGPWPERHPQWRLLLAALAVWAVLYYRSPPARAVKAMTTAAALALVLACCLVATVSSSKAPTNRIPWMAGVSLLSLAVLSLVYTQKEVPANLRLFWLAASALGPVTALISGVRGSWPLMVVWPLVLFYLHRAVPGLLRNRGRWLIPGLVVALIGGLYLIPEDDSPLVRLRELMKQEAASEAKGFSAYNTSTGIRLALYAKGWKQIQEQPLFLGTGPNATKDLIGGVMTDEHRPEAIPFIRHMHNEILHVWIEFGLLGLLGYLAIAAGLILMIREFGRGNHDPCVVASLMGLLLMHVITGLSNVNFAHNYYPVMLSLSVSLVLLGAVTKTQPGGG